MSPIYQAKKLSVVAKTFLDYLIAESINYTAEKQFNLAHTHG